MASVAQVERALLAAEQAGDGKSARVFANALRKREQQKQASREQKRLVYEEDQKRREEELQASYEEMEALNFANENAFMRGIDIGSDQISQATGSSLEGLGGLLGLQGLEEYGAEVALENEADIQRKSRFSKRWDDVEDISSFGSYFSETLGQTTPITAIGMGAAIGGSAGAAFGGIGALPGAVIGAVTAGISQLPFFFGMNRERQKEVIDQGLQAEVDEGAAFLGALGQASLQGIADRLLVGMGMTPRLVQQGGLFTRAVKGVGAGAVVEVPNEIGQQLIERVQAGLPAFNDEAIKEYKEAGIAAGLIGGTIGGGANVIQGGVEAPVIDDTAPGTQLDLFPEELETAQAEREAARAEEEGQLSLFDDDELAPAPVESASFLSMPEEEWASYDPSYQQATADRATAARVGPEKDVGSLGLTEAEYYELSAERQRRKQNKEAFLGMSEEEWVSYDPSRTDSEKNIRDLGLTETEYYELSAERQEGKGQLGLFDARQQELPLELGGLGALDVAREQQLQREASERVQQFPLPAGDPQQDMFALEKEQLLKRGFEPETTVAQTDAELGTLLRDPAQMDLVDEVEFQELVDAEAAAEEAEFQQLLEAETTVELKQKNKKLRRVQSAIERGRVDKSTQARQGVLDTVLEASSNTGSRINLENRFSKALTKAGFSNTALTEQEQVQITNHTLGVAERKAALSPTEDTGADVSGMEAFIPERGARREADEAQDVGRGADEIIEEEIVEATPEPTPTEEDIEEQAPTPTPTPTPPPEQVAFLTPQAETPTARDRTAEFEAAGVVDEYVDVSGTGVAGTEATDIVPAEELDTNVQIDREVELAQEAKRRAGQVEPTRARTALNSLIASKLKRNPAELTERQDAIKELVDAGQSRAEAIKTLNTEAQQAETKERQGQVAKEEQAKTKRKQAGKAKELAAKKKKTPEADKTVKTKRWGFISQQEADKIAEIAQDNEAWVDANLRDSGAFAQFVKNIKDYKGFRETVGKITPTAKDMAAIKKLLAGGIPKDKESDEYAAYFYLKKMPHAVDALYMAIFDTAHDSPQYRTQEKTKRSEKEIKADTKQVLELLKGDKPYEEFTEVEAEKIMRWYFGGTSREAGLKALTWANKNLSPKTNKWINLELQREIDALTEIRLSFREKRAQRELKKKTTIRDIAKTITRVKGAGFFRGKAEKPGSITALDEAQLKEINELIEAGDDLSISEAINSIGGVFPSIGENLDLEAPIHPAVYMALEGSLGVPNKGNLELALELIADTSDSPRVKQIASVMAKMVGETRVVLGVYTKDLPADATYEEKVVAAVLDKSRDELRVKNPNAESVGTYTGTTETKYPKVDAILNNVIVLNISPDVDRISAVTLLHEMAHAVTADSLTNKKLPTTKELERLFEQAEPLLGTAYGAENVFEFVAEAYTNEQFRQELATIPAADKEGQLMYEPMSILQKMQDIIARIFQRLGFKMVKRPERRTIKTLELVDPLISEIMAPSTGGYSGPTLSMIATSNQVPSFVDKVITTTRESAKLERAKGLPKFIGYFKDVFTDGRIPKTIKAAATWALSSAGIADVIRGAYKSEAGFTIHRLFGEQEAEIQQMSNTMRATVKELALWEQNNPDEVASFNELVNLSTFFKVHLGNYEFKEDGPLKGTRITKKSYEKSGEVDKEGVELNNIGQPYDENQVEFYEKMKPAYDALKKSGGAAKYNEVFKTYEIILERMKDNLNARIDAIVTDGMQGAIEKYEKEGLSTKEAIKKAEAEGEADKKQFKDLVASRLFNKAHINPYSPLTREGDFWLQYNVNAEPVFQTFNSKAQREAAEAELRVNEVVDSDSIVSFEGLENINYQNVPPTSYVGQVLAILESQGVPKEVKDQIVGAFVDAAPESSFAKSLQGRKGDYGRLGFQQSVLRGLNLKGFGLLRQTVNIKYSQEIYAEISKFDTDLKRKVERASYLNSALKNAKATENEQAIKKAQKEIDAFEKANGNIKLHTAADHSVLINDLRSRAQVSTNPSNSRLERAAVMANRLTFLGTIGANVSSAILQMASIPMVLMPHLQGKTSWRSAHRNVMAASRAFAGSGLSQEVTAFSGRTQEFKESFVGAPSIDNYYVADENGRFSLRSGLDLDNEKVFFEMPVKGKTNGKQNVKKLTEKQFIEMILPLVQLASDRGLLSKSLMADILALDVSGKKQETWGKELWEVFNTATALPFQVSERYNRQVALVASYLNEMERMATNPNKNKGEDKLNNVEMEELARETAIQDTEQTSGGALLATAPKVAQRHIFRVAAMYKTWGLLMYYHQLKTALTYVANTPLFKDADPYIRKQARDQVIGSIGATALFSGVSGISVYGALVALFDAFLTDEDEESMDTKVRKYLGEGMYKGGANYVTDVLGVGLDVSQRIALSNLIVGTNRYNFNRSPEEEIYDVMFGAAGSTSMKIKRGWDDILEGEFQRGVEQMAPASVGNMLKAARYATEGTKTRRGDPITTDFNAGLIAAKFFGFAPAEYTFAQEVSQDVKRIDKAVNSKRSQLLKEYYISSRVGDYGKRNKTMREIREFNRKHGRKNRGKVRITPETIDKSMAQHLRQSGKMFNGVALSPLMQDHLLMYAREYDRGFEPLR
jgi:hypothetical protein